MAAVCYLSVLLVLTDLTGESRQRQMDSETVRTVSTDGLCPKNIIPEVLVFVYVFSG